MKQRFNSRNFNADDLNRFYEYDVLDRNDKHLGNVNGLWQDQSGQPAFVGVKTSWLFGKTHVIPLQEAQIDAEEGHIYVGYDEDKIKDAPSFDTDAELQPNDEQEIYRYYGLQRGTGTAQTTATQQRPAAQMPRAAAGAEEATMALHEEQMRVGKREVSAGEVRLRKIVRTEVVNRPVELKREDVVVERVPANEARESERPFQGEEQVIPLRREEAVVEKENRIREGVRARKTASTERETVSEDLRKEDVEVLQGQHRKEDGIRRNADREDRK